MQDIINIINTVGFPIAVAIGCGYYIYKNNQASREDNSRREERMYQQFAKFNDTLNRFNDTLNKIDNRLANVEDTINHND